MTIREFTVGEKDPTFNTEKSALLFFIPNHCAGCKRAINILNGINTDGWDIALVDSENLDFRELIAENQVSTAPTFIYRKGESRHVVFGLKNFLAGYKSIFDIED